MVALLLAIAILVAANFYVTLKIYAQPQPQPSPAPAVKAPPKQTFDAIELLLFGPDGHVKHEVNLHQEVPPETYSYAGCKYHLVSRLSDGAYAYRPV